MIEVESQLRNWGRSIGLVIPKEAIIKEHLKEGDTISLLILKKSNALHETFGIFKFKKDTQTLLNEADKENWDE